MFWDLSNEKLSFAQWHFISGTGKVDYSIIYRCYVQTNQTEEKKIHFHEICVDFRLTPSRASPIKDQWLHNYTNERTKCLKLFHHLTSLQLNISQSKSLWLNSNGFVESLFMRIEFFYTSFFVSHFIFIISLTILDVVNSANHHRMMEWKISISHVEILKLRSRWVAHDYTVATAKVATFNNKCITFFSIAHTIWCIQL